MALSFQHLLIKSSPRLNFYLTTRKPKHLSLISPSHSKTLFLKPSRTLQNLSSSLRTHQYRLKAYEFDATQKPIIKNFDFDSFLSFVESLCLISSTIVTIGFAVSYLVLGARKSVFTDLGYRVLVWGVLMLFGGVLVGVWIRKRQWRKFYAESVKAGGSSLNLVERVEKLEDDLKNSSTIIRALSRQLEKLGIRFRVTRKALKEPIAETAALAQKNSEATRALAMREDILEKELREIQKVLLAMQEQQQKQLELILALGKVRKPLASRQGSGLNQHATETTKSSHRVIDGTRQIEPNRTQVTECEPGYQQ